MDKPAIKKFAVWARNKLIADTKYRAGLVGVTETAIAEPLPQSNETVQFFDVGLPQPYRIEGDAVTQRQRFVAELNKETAKQGSYTAAYQTVVDKVAYTWFNRLIAVRYMEVNDLLPSRTRVLSSADGRAEPQIVTSPFDAVLDYTPAEQQQIVTLKNDNKLDEAFRLLFLKQCAALGDCLPRLFEQVDDYMPLLLALSFTDKDGVVCHLVNDIPESDWQDAVQIVGWLYQYYNTEPKEQVFANLKKNIKISAENIPAATQLFTPDWIVRYMVENSLGRLWSEGHPDFDKSEWKYYLDEAPQEPQVAQQLAELRKGYAALTPEDIKCIDPCMGSGHILAYLFDVLMQIYRSAGYAAKYNQEFAAQKALTYMGTAQIVMPENYIALFSAPDKQEAKAIVENAKPAIRSIIDCIRNGMEFPAPRNNLYDRFMSGAVNPIFYKGIVKADAFTVSDACIGCGKCVQLCPLNNIRLDKDKPVWGSNCTHCMACICYCPKEAIEYGKRSVGKPRYHFEALGVAESIV